MCLEGGITLTKTSDKTRFTKRLERASLGRTFTDVVDVAGGLRMTTVKLSGFTQHLDTEDLDLGSVAYLNDQSLSSEPAPYDYKTTWASITVHSLPGFI